jgi:hypothetical protein
MSGFEMSGFKTSETSSLQNVRFSKRLVFKKSGFQKARLQNVRFQNVITGKYYNTSDFEKVQYFIEKNKKTAKKYRTKTLRRYSKLRGTLPRESIHKQKTNNYEDFFDFFGPKWHSLRSLPFQGLKKSRFQGPPLQTPLVMDYSSIQIYINHINNRYINS